MRCIAEIEFMYPFQMNNFCSLILRRLSRWPRIYVKKAHQCLLVAMLSMMQILPACNECFILSDWLFIRLGRLYVIRGAPRLLVLTRVDDADPVQLVQVSSRFM
jgi:hypothetical protein